MDYIRLYRYSKLPLNWFTNNIKRLLQSSEFGVDIEEPTHLKMIIKNNKY